MWIGYELIITKFYIPIVGGLEKDMGNFRPEKVLFRKD